jgi:hypothetical protein
MKKALSVRALPRLAPTGTARRAPCPFMYDKQEQAGRTECVQPAL